MVRWVGAIFPMKLPPLMTVGLVDVASGRLQRSFEVANQRWVNAIGFGSSDRTIVTEGVQAGQSGSSLRADPTLRTFWDCADSP